MNNKLAFVQAAAYLMTLVTASEAQKFSNDFISNVQSGNIELQPSTIYQRTVFALGGVDSTTELLKSDNNKTVGISSFQGQKLFDSQVFIINKIKVGYVEAATSGNTAGTVKYINDRANMPAALLNSDLQIWVDGSLKFEVSIARLASAAAANEQTGDIFDLPAFITIPGGSQVELKIRAAGTLAPGANNSCFFEVLAEGFVTKKRVA